MFSQRRFKHQVHTYLIDESFNIQSNEFLSGTCIPKFLLKIYSNQKFESFHGGSKLSIPSLSKNRITIFNRWSLIEQALDFLEGLEMSHKKRILQEQMQLLNTKEVTKLKYSNEIIMRAFEYYMTSRTTYNLLRQDFELPSIATLTRLTSKVNNTSDAAFINGIFSSLEGVNKNFVLLIDEIYVKSSVTYHGGSLYGSAVNRPDDLATTVLAFMLVPLFSGPSFLAKMLPVYKLNSGFQFEQANILINNVKNSGGKIVVIICDNNRVNQAFFKKFDRVSQWKTVDDMFLLFDFVHLLKSIRNNWITEKTKQISFSCDGEEFTANWNHIQDLQKLEAKENMKMSLKVFD